MTNLVRWLFSTILVIGSIVVVNINKDFNLFLSGYIVCAVGVLLLTLTFLFRQNSPYLRKRYGNRFVFLISFFFFILTTLYLVFLRSYLNTHCTMVLIGVLGVIGLPQALPAPSNSSSDSSQARWEDFDMGVLQEGWPVTPNESFEASMRNRIWRLEQEYCRYLLDLPKGEYWSSVKTQLDQADSQAEYNSLLAFEGQDLQFRELKHEAFLLYERILGENPSLADEAPYAPTEVFDDFVENREELIWSERAPGQRLSVKEKDRRFLAFLEKLIRDLREKGPETVRAIYESDF